MSRTPFRISLGGGSTDLPSYYEKYDGFIFAVAINLYMDVFIKEPIVDDYIHMHYLHYESELSVDDVKHTIGRESLRIVGINNKVLISFKADTPAGTGLGSSGACSVALLKGLSLYKGIKMENIEAAEKSFVLTQNLGLPDGKQDPYACALGDFSVLEINKDGIVTVSRPSIAEETINRFLINTILFYTGVRRDSKPLLSLQDSQKALELKHYTKELGRQILDCFIKGDLDTFGMLMDKHWDAKRKMVGGASNELFDEIYNKAKKCGVLGGKILGAGGGGYFLFYCPNEKIKELLRLELKKYSLREVPFDIDRIGARAEIIHF